MPFMHLPAFSGQDKAPPSTKSRRRDLISGPSPPSPSVVFIRLQQQAGGRFVCTPAPAEECKSHSFNVHPSVLCALETRLAFACALLEISSTLAGGLFIPSLYKIVFLEGEITLVMRSLLVYTYVDVCRFFRTLAKTPPPPK